MTMIERVARAILKARFYDYEPEAYGKSLETFFAEIDEDHVEQAHYEARAVIEAMREPTEAMVDAFHVAIERWKDEEGEDEDVFIAMIDAALSEAQP